MTSWKDCQNSMLFLNMDEKGENNISNDEISDSKGHERISVKEKISSMSEKMSSGMNHDEKETIEEVI